MHFPAGSLTIFACVLVVVCSLQAVVAQETECTLDQIRKNFITGCKSFSFFPLPCEQLAEGVFGPILNACKGIVGIPPAAEADPPAA